MLDDFAKKLIAGNHSIQSKGGTPNYASEQGDFMRLILTHDMTTSNEPKMDYKSKAILLEQSDLAPQLVELDGFNLPCLASPKILLIMNLMLMILNTLIFSMKTVKCILKLCGLRWTTET